MIISSNVIATKTYYKNDLLLPSQNTIVKLTIVERSTFLVDGRCKSAKNCHLQILKIRNATSSLVKNKCKQAINSIRVNKIYF